MYLYKINSSAEVLQSLFNPIMAKSRKTKKNWKSVENFDICLFVIFNCSPQEFISGWQKGGLLCPYQILQFFSFCLISQDFKSLIVGQILGKIVNKVYFTRYHVPHYLWRSSLYLFYFIYFLFI